MHKVSDPLLSELNRLISSLIGLHFTGGREQDLERGVEKACLDLGLDGPEALLRGIKAGTLKRQHIEVLAGYLTIGETYFFRDRDALRALEEQVLPGLVRKRENDSRMLRVWSAGCSTGEEPYTIAILLSRIIPDLSGWKITILATDINAKALKKAEEARYTEWSFRDTPGWVKECYFRKKGEVYELKDEIRNMVTFSYLNLAEDVYPSLVNNTNAMDVILCRNVLMYFSGDLAKKTVRGLYNALVEGGYLLVNPAEAVNAVTSVFVPVNYPGATVFKKDAEKPRPQHVRTFEAREALRKASAAPKPSHRPGAFHKTADKSTAVEKKAPAVKPRYEQAVAAFREGRYALAASLLEPLAEEKKAQKVYTLLSRVYANQGMLDGAEKWCEKAIAADTLDPANYYLLATILQEEGRLDEAVKSLKKALYLDHGFVLPYFMLGNILLGRGQERAALRHFRNAVELLSRHRPEDIVPESDGVSARRLKEIIDSVVFKEKSA